MTLCFRGYSEDDIYSVQSKCEVGGEFGSTSRVDELKCCSIDNRNMATIAALANNMRVG